MQLAERLEDRRLVREVEVALLGEQALEDELVRRRSAQADVGVAVVDDLVVRAVVLRGQLVSPKVVRESAAMATESPLRTTTSVVMRRSIIRGGVQAASRRAAVGADCQLALRPRPELARPTPAVRQVRAARGTATRPSTPAKAPTAAPRRRLPSTACAGGVDGDRHVQVTRRRHAEHALQEDLARRRREQVGAAHDVGDPLRGVVDDDGELIGVEAVAAAHDEVADVAREPLLLCARTGDR